MNFDMFTLTTGRGVSQSWRTLEKRGPWWIKHVEDEIVYIVLVNFFIHLKYWVEKGLPSVFGYISDIWPIYAYVNISLFWIVLTRFLDCFIPKNSKSITSANKSPFFEVLHFSCIFQKTPLSFWSRPISSLSTALQRPKFWSFMKICAPPYLWLKFSLHKTQICNTFCCYVIPPYFIGATPLLSGWCLWSIHSIRSEQAWPE